MNAIQKLVESILVKMGFVGAVDGKYIFGFKTISAYSICG
uniref:Uncharacterized protein n=1 Tax=Salmonella typhimurium TaxID=90371 RepID=A0A0P0C3Q0_SALTM|nr:hypothetical protein [Salmonella enterica subsp. enterica serovar Typhimurium]